MSARADTDVRCRVCGQPFKVRGCQPERCRGALYKHDCDACVYLGAWSAGHAVSPAVDLYVCPKGIPSTTYIARFSDVPADYTSGALLIPLVPALAEAQRRDLARGS